MTLRIRTIALLVVPLASAVAQDTARVEPVIVTATRTPIGLGSLPVAVTVIQGDDLRQRGIATVAAALTEVTSAYIAQAGSQGGTTSLFLRGGESKYVKVLIDGVPVNDPGGTYDFASLTTDDVERIEVVRGPASVVHGADAVTGVVNVITRRGAGKPGVELALSAGAAPRDRLDATSPGTAATTHMSATTSGAVVLGSWSLGLARHQTTGLYAFNNDYANTGVKGRFDLAPVWSTDLRLSLGYTTYRFNYPTNSGGTPTDSNAYRFEDRYVVGVEARHEFAAGVLAVLTLNSSVNDGGTNDGLDAGGNSYLSQDYTRRRGADLRVRFFDGAAANASVGVAVERQEQKSEFESQSPFGPFNGDFRASRKSSGAYGELALLPSSSFTATVGARVDDNEQFGTFLTGRVGLSWRPIAATRLRATAGNAFREPSFFENYSTGFVSGNPDLQPERTQSVDVGIEREIAGGRANVSVTGFMQRFSDMIDYTGSTTACGYSYCNIASARSNGLELETRARLGHGVEASLGGTLLETKVEDPGFDTSAGGLYHRGEALIRRPKQKWTGELAYRDAGPITASVRVLAVGKRTDRDFTSYPSAPVTLPAYERLDAAATYAIPYTATGQHVLTLRVENVLNVHYQNIFNFLAPRRTIEVGVRSRF